jgi:hypothetical protein
MTVIVEPCNPQIIPKAAIHTFIDADQSLHLTLLLNGTENPRR